MIVGVVVLDATMIGLYYGFHMQHAAGKDAADVRRRLGRADADRGHDHHEEDQEGEETLVILRSASRAPSSLSATKDLLSRVR